MTDDSNSALPLQDDAAAESPGAASKPIGVLVKSFAVIEAMADLGEPAPLREVARVTGLPKGTLFRVLQTLVQLGYVNQIGKTGSYHLSSKVYYLGRNARLEDLKMKVLPQMRVLHRRFNETVNLGVLDGIFVYYIAAIEAQRALSWYVPAGTRDMFHSTALGRAIVAHLPEEQRDALVTRGALESRTARTTISPDALRAVLAGVRDDGVAREVEENDDGVACIGAPVFLDGRVAASVSLSIPTNRYSAELGDEVAAALRELDLRF
ncbi:IclR family transcriptional regulator [Oceanicola granulosus]|uniref:IclR family transcriptional regulator n=1 Tax=Oceanicola granulosus TaxID=252302 RepID=UPI00030EA7AB|nr:IclR family transcriptional regulator [Oceanicola granulosus]